MSEERASGVRRRTKTPVRLRHFFYILLNELSGYLGQSRGDHGKRIQHCFGELYFVYVKMD